jgi:hypothetical protein
MTNLDTFKGYPHLMKWIANEKEAVANIVSLTKIELGDEFYHMGRINDNYYNQSGKVVEILEERKPKGTHPEGATFYRLKLEGELNLMKQ